MATSDINNNEFVLDHDPLLGGDVFWFATILLPTGLVLQETLRRHSPLKTSIPAENNK